MKSNQIMNMLDHVVPDEVVIGKIMTIRDQRVMLNYDLAVLYGVQTKVLKQAVRRNINRFPADFMFELTKEEFQILRSQSVTSKSGGMRYVPMAFTEHGVLMLSSALRSDRAIEMNIQIVRIFSKMRQLIFAHEEMLVKIEQIERKATDQGDKIKLLFDYLKKFVEVKSKKRRQIGYNAG